MKRIYLILATIAAFLMVGCSDNDDVIIDPNPVGGEEAIFFSIGASDGLTTKATTAPLTGENYIHNLTVLLFDAEETDRPLVYKKTETFDTALAGTAYIEDLEIEPGKYDILLIANTKNDYTKVANLAAVNSLLNDVTDQKQDYLLMVSKLFTDVEIDYITQNGLDVRRTYYYMVPEHYFEKDKTAFTSKQTFSEVYTGLAKLKPVELVRLASRIQLESIAVNFTENLAGASFRLDKVYLVNARPTTLLIPDNNGTYEAKPETIKYYRGAPEEFKVIYGMIAPDAVCNVKEDYYAKEYEVKITKENSATFATGMFQTYAFENHTSYVYSDKLKEAYDTRLVIEGEIILPTGQELGQSYYHIPIKGDNFQLVHNNIYSINVTITSYGYNNPDGSTTTDPNDPDNEIPVDPKDPDDPEDPEDPNGPNTPDNNAKIDISISVKPWNVINQYEEDPDPVVTPTP